MVFDFILVILFFVIFKFYDIYAATAVIMIGAFLQVLWTRFRLKKYDKKQIMLLVIVVLFGGMTLYFHNPIFIKWKPTIVFWMFGIALFFSQFVGSKPLMQHMLESILSSKQPIPKNIWHKINAAWATFFILIGTVNIVIAYCFSTDAWVNFKLWGVLSAFILFSIAQSLYLAKYIELEK